MLENEPLTMGQTLEEWVQGKCDEWRDSYRQNYDAKHKEYYRLWRGIWADEDKTRESERSKLISPALQQAVESSVAEIEEATFGRGQFFDIKDDMLDQDKTDIEYLKNKLTEDFQFAKVRKGISDCILNAAVFGTGIGEIVLDTVKEMKPATQPVMDGQLQAVGVEIMDRTIVSFRPIMPNNFLIDPLATSIDEALGCATDEMVPKHSVELLQEKGTYEKVDLGVAYEDHEMEMDPEFNEVVDDKVRLIKYYGLVPSYLLEEGDDDSEYTEAIVIIGNGKLLKATKTPYMMEDRGFVAFSWDSVPNKFWGRGICEKGYNSQKALDAELRARVDALALTVHPMMAMDATRIPRGTKPEVRPGKLLLTNGDPKSVLNPFNFGNVSQITFSQAAALQQMVQQATGAIDSSGVSGAVNGEATAAGISMSLGAIIKRHKRTLINFQENLLIPFVEKAAWRYMQYEPELYPVKDFKFIASSSLGIMAREYEVTQLVQLMQTMGQDSPAYLLLIESVIQNMNISNREELINKLREAQQPNPEQQQAQQQQMQAEMAQMQAQVDLYSAQSELNRAQAVKYMAEAQAVPEKVELDKLRVATTNLKDGENDDIEFERRMRVAELYLKEKELDTKQGNMQYGQQ